MTCTTYELSDAVAIVLLTEVGFTHQEATDIYERVVKLHPRSKKDELAFYLKGGNVEDWQEIRRNAEKTLDNATTESYNRVQQEEKLAAC